ncbi:conjugal transfer protein TraR [Sphingomonas sp. ACRSK]|uniref:conjugal transfer protein TraR n=1 Tax=Sphingomonas sp. ACRSK TaxID=2918213 RepID=UPI001EF551D2|nr:conjugal transfer protein TraR [Sphingomonas sp. ACRSK]MCG7348953.1 conjugal transfer protein TraR [Sphingomonas sp. ACRSK]
MADEVDQANAIAEAHLERSLAAARAPIPAGQPGECEQCGEDMPRLVDGRCGYCRDGRKRP